ncbi:MAG TPA: efflux RND transporter periplasmic adaptor subunit [Verrucomicrobiae bacterium]
MARKKSSKGWWIFLALIAIGGGAGWWKYTHKEEKPVEVQTEKVQRRDLTELVVATGRIQPVLQVKISPEVSGEIIELPIKEGQVVKKGDLLMKIKPDFYTASRNSSEANLKAVLANKDLSAANLEKARLEHARSSDLKKSALISESQYLEAKTAFDVAQAQLNASTHQADVARASLARAEEELAKTTIYSPLDAVVTKLNSQAGERVVGTATMAGTDVMTLSNLEEMEARVDIGEIDVVLIAVGQKTRLEVDAFRDRKFTGIVTEIANTAKTSALGTQQEATRFEVRIRVQEKEIFRPGMSVTAEIETRYRTNVLTVPFQSVTTRPPKGNTNAVATASTNAPAATKKEKENANKPIEVVFLKEGDTVKMVPVKRGISDQNYAEITEGVSEGQEVVSGSYKAINRDLEDGKKVAIGTGDSKANEEKKP